jgi:putative tricarboxylic transport membrane protein
VRARLTRAETTRRRTAQPLPAHHAIRDGAMLQSYRIVGAVTAAIGAAAFYGGSLLPPVTGQNVGPNVFPMVAGGGLFLCGMLIALGAGRRYEQEIEADVAANAVAHVGAQVGAPVGAQTGANAGAAPAPPEVRHGRLHALRALVPPALLVFYALAVDSLGFVPTAALIALTLCRALGAPWRSAILVALLAPPAVHFAFANLLRVPLPPGLLPMPW